MHIDVFIFIEENKYKLVYRVNDRLRNQTIAIGILVSCEIICQSQTKKNRKIWISTIFSRLWLKSILYGFGWFFFYRKPDSKPYCAMTLIVCYVWLIYVIYCFLSMKMRFGQMYVPILFFFSIQSIFFQVRKYWFSMN
jgi:hypothetical protein